MSGPYAETAGTYLERGWSPIRLRFKKKAPPPEGFTGALGNNVRAPDIRRWSKLGPGNVALRLPPSVLGIDVDDYGEKTGGASLAAVEARLGALPPTWRSTSRDADLVSGIRFFRVPPEPGQRWVDEVGPNIEVIHYGHRYAVVAPSVHPEGREYGWFDPDGFPTDELPAVTDLPDLPAAWAAELARGGVNDRTAKADLSDTDVSRWLERLPGGEPCRAVAGALADAERELAGSGSRHGVGLRHVMQIVRYGEQGHTGAGTALDTLESMWVGALTHRPPGDREWARMVAGAVGSVLGSPTNVEERGCCSRPEDDFGSLHSAIFGATPVLQHIERAAHSRLVSSDALLGYVLARVLAEVSPEVALPPVVGSRASLNLGFAVVGRSGAGKSATLGVSREVLGVFDQRDLERNIGSGEGVAETFLEDEWEDRNGRRVRTGRKVLIADPRRILMADEIDQLGATQNRSGATISSTIRSALTGGSLGQENATAERKRHVPEGAYRLVLMVGVQPTRSETLLRDADAGTPQRFVWVLATDAMAPSERVEWPGSLNWSPPVTLPGEIDYPGHIKDEVWAARHRNLTGEGDELESHRLLTHLKVAAGLAFLHGDSKITDQWWGIAGHVIDASLLVQRDCQRVLLEEKSKESETRARAAGRAAVITAEVVDADKAGVARAKKAILGKVTAAWEEGVSWADARAAVQHKDRDAYATKARAELENLGLVRVEDVSVGKRKGERLWPEGV